jgi:class 3 adenylate cyclase/tetratricopeptide (TPR) repeat protein
LAWSDEALARAAPYVSPLILRALSQDPDRRTPWIERIEGTLLMADISGFTRMSERLAETGKEGAELLTDIINGYFTAFLEAARREGGNNLKFGGDALLILFEGAGHARRAGRTALAMQRANKRMPGLRLGGERIRPSVSIGLHSGVFWSAAVGRPEIRMQQVLFGPDVNRVVDAEGVASAGEIIATAETVGLVGERAVFEAAGQMHRLVTIRQGAAEKTRGDEPLPAGISGIGPYLPPPITWSLQSDQAFPGGGEHRQVAVLFIHLTGLEEALERGGPEGALGRLQSYAETLADLTEKFGGFLAANDIYTEGVKFIVLFGAPVAREQDSANAMRLAIELTRFLKESGSPLKHRIGINSGFAFAGDIGAEFRREYTVIGDAVNVSARLMSAAEPGQTLVGRATAERSGPSFEYRELPPIRVKGKSGEIEIRELRTEAAAFAATVSQASPLAGRDEELASLRETCSRVEEGGGRSLVISGEPGVGKSRLTLEFGQYLRARGWAVHRAQCYSHESGNPFEPWGQLLQSVLSVEGSDDDKAQVLERLEDLCPGQVHLASLLNPVIQTDFPENVVVRSFDHETRQQRLFGLVAAILQASAQRTPLMLLIEDVHESDEASLELIRYVVEGAGESRLLVCLTQRPGKRRVLAAGTAADALELAELDEEAAERLARRSTGMPDAPQVVMDALIAKARGNPLFMEEIGRTIRGSAELQSRLRGEPEAALAAVEELVPDRLQNVVMARIDRLERRPREVLLVASVIGTGIEPDVLAAVLGRGADGASLSADLAVLEAEEVLRSAAAGRLNFVHSLLGEIAYSSLSYSRRRRLHREVARYLEGHRSDLETYLESLAHHFERGGEREKTFEYSAKAGDKARRVFANADAIRHYRRAVSVAPELTLEERDVAAIHGSLGDVLELAGRHNAALAAYTQALGACLGRRYRKQGVTPSMVEADAARRRSGDLRAAAAGVCRKIGYVRERQSLYQPALDWFELSLSLLPRQDAAGRASTYIGLSGMHYRAGDYDQAERWALRGLRSAAGEDDSAELARAQNLLGVVYRDRGQVRRAITHRLKALAMYERLGQLSGQADTLNNLGLDYFNDGQWEESTERFAACLKIAGQIGDVELLAIVRNNVGEVYLSQGRTEAALDEFRWAAEAAPRLGNLAVGALAEANLGEALVMLGRSGDGRQALNHSARVFRQIGARTLLLEAELRLGEAYLKEGALSRTLSLAERCVEAGRRLDAPGSVGRGLALRGLARTRQRRWADAEHDLREAIALFGRIGGTYPGAKARLALATLYARRAETEGMHLRTAEAEARKALRVFDRLGASLDKKEAQAFLGRTAAETRRRQRAGRKKAEKRAIKSR